MAIIDVHAHILPAIDDGSKNMGTTRCMLRMAYGQGIRAIIATPHYTRHRWHTRPEQIRELAEQVQKEADRITPGMKIYAGQEINYFDGMDEYLAQGRLLTLADSRFVLVEFFPSVPWSQMETAVRRLTLAGYTPVIAHAERYECLYSGDKLRALKDAGSYVQMNYQSLTASGFLSDIWSLKERNWCRKALLEGCVDFLGTDMHGLRHRPPRCEEACGWIKNKAGEDVYQRLTEENPTRIINDGESLRERIQKIMAGDNNNFQE